MADGTTRPLEQVKAGNLVLSKNEATGEVAAKKVLKTFTRDGVAILNLKIGSEVIGTTSEHPFYVQGKGFVKAGELGVGNAIVTRAGPSVTLSATTTAAHTARVYNFEVEGFHTYFVGQNALWVHNACSFAGVANLGPTQTLVSGNGALTWILHQGDGNGTYGWNHIFRRHVDLNHPEWGINGNSPRLSHFDPSFANDDIIDLLKWTMNHGNRRQDFYGDEVWRVRVNWKGTGYRTYDATIIRNSPQGITNPQLVGYVKSFHPVGPNPF